MSASTFKFKQFEIAQDKCGMKIGTDGVLLGAWAPHKEDVRRILDIGTGTGVIAIMQAQRCPNATVVGVEIDEKSAQQASENMAASPYQNRLSVHLGTIQDFSQDSEIEYDLIVSNPPFFSGGTFSKDQARNDVRHTVKLPNGDLLRCAHHLLSTDGIFSVILPYMEGLRFKEMAGQYGFHLSHMTEVMPKADKSVERLLMAFKRHPVEEVVTNSLVIQHEKRNDYTDDYIELTKAFYLKM